MEPLRITTKLKRKICIDRRSDSVHMWVEDTGCYRSIGTLLRPDECKAVEEALAAARKETTLTDCACTESETPEAIEPTPKVENRKDDAMLICGNVSTGTEYRQRINRAEAAQLRDILDRYIRGEPDATEPDKPNAEVAEVVAFHKGHDAKMLRIGSVGFHYVTIQGEGSCRTVNRAEMQRMMLAWGYELRDVQSATQAIAE